MLNIRTNWSTTRNTVYTLVRTEAIILAWPALVVFICYKLDILLYLYRIRHCSYCSRSIFYSRQG